MIISLSTRRLFLVSSLIVLFFETSCDLFDKKDSDEQTEESEETDSEDSDTENSSGAEKFGSTTGYDTSSSAKMCLVASTSCPGPTKSACPVASPVDECTSSSALKLEDQGASSNREALYTWAQSLDTAAMTSTAVPSDLSWNQWSGEGVGTCGSAGSCDNIYTKYILVYDDDNCWPKEKAIPVIANARATDAQMLLCAQTIKHLLGKKPLGAFVRSPTEQRDWILDKKVMFTCGNSVIQEGDSEDSKTLDTTKLQYPYLEGEGGGGEYNSPTAYAESTGMCFANNNSLSDTYKEGGTRYGGNVTTEEYGHTIFDVAISRFDPEGWLAVQKAEAIAYDKYIKDSSAKGGHKRDDDWDCHTASTEYFAAGVDMLLYNTRIGENHQATTRTELRDNDPNLWCLTLRYYELNNKFSVCSNGPEMSDVEQTVDCKAVLTDLGVTTFGPEGSAGAKLGGAKSNSTLITSSSANCQSSNVSSCTSYQ